MFSTPYSPPTDNLEDLDLKNNFGYLQDHANVFEDRYGLGRHLMDKSSSMRMQR